ncbi:uncharacterized protein LOC127754118 isoform X2 [Oryza glaberrima]|uniref:uncharacterized protein LOC127754118 isoform X2 n=1 Tax=Oryza glaberrima TaxID=4538 RepID=UPI00224C34F1|nr:uncharacterized protein LOC127754118 isoform X2 [Oryza glaberrima]
MVENGAAVAAGELSDESASEVHRGAPGTAVQPPTSAMAPGSGGGDGGGDGERRRRWRAAMAPDMPTEEKLERSMGPLAATAPGVNGAASSSSSSSTQACMISLPTMLGSSRFAGWTS